MPRVPVYESKVRTEALPTPKVGAEENALAAIGKGLSSVGDVAENIGADLAKERDQEDKYRLGQLLNEYEQFKAGQFYSNDQFSPGLMMLNGEDVYRPDPETGDVKYLNTISRLSKFRDSLVERAPERYREMADERLRNMQTSAEVEAERFAGSQRELAHRAAYDKEFNRLLESAEAGILTSDKAFDLAVENLSLFAPNDSKVAADRETLYRANTVSAVRNLTKNGAWAAARGMLSVDREKLGKHYDVLMSEVERAEALDAADKAASATIDENLISGKNVHYDASGWVDEAKARAAWAKRSEDFPQSYKDEADRMFDKRLRNNIRAQDAMKDAYYDRAHGDFDRGGRKRSAISLDIASFMSRHDQERWARFAKWEADDAARAERMRRARENHRKSGGEDSDFDRQNLSALQRDIQDSPEAYASMSPEAFDAMWGDALGNLREKGFSLYDKHYKDVKKNNGLLTSRRDEANMKREAIARAEKLNPKLSKERKAALEDRVSAGIASWQYSNTDKFVTPDVMRDIVDRAAASLADDTAPRRAPARPGVPKGPAARSAPPAAKPAPAAAPAAVPPAFRARLEESYRKNNKKPPTDAAVAEAYSNYLNRKGGSR